MENYLKWLHEKMDKKPFALVLDCFRAHIDEKVKKLANDLNIELIIVPACGTGIYQPLDRKIFGIVKAKLRARELHNRTIQSKEDDANRYSIIREMLEQIWGEIKEEAL